MFLKRFIPTLACALPWLLTGAELRAENSTANLDPIVLMQQAIDGLKTLNSFSFSSQSGYEVTQDNGQKLEFGSQREIQLQRPASLHIKFQNRDGENGDIYLDGKHITLLSQNHHVYAQTKQTGSIDNALEYMAHRLEIPIPLSDFFMPDPGESLLNKITDSTYLGTAVLDGIATYNLAFRNDKVDYQAWLSQEEIPKLMRIVIIYKNEPGQPTFWAQMSKWQANPLLTATQLNPTIPPNYERVPILMTKSDEMTLSNEETSP